MPGLPPMPPIPPMPLPPGMGMLQAMGMMGGPPPPGMHMGMDHPPGMGQDPHKMRMVCFAFSIYIACAVW